MVERARETFGRLDYLVNNAGINPAYGPMLDTEVEAARKILEVNVLGAFSWTQKAVAGGLGTAGRPRRSGRQRRLRSPGSAPPGCSAGTP